MQKFNLIIKGKVNKNHNKNQRNSLLKYLAGKKIYSFYPVEKLQEEVKKIMVNNYELGNIIKPSDITEVLLNCYDSFSEEIKEKYSFDDYIKELFKNEYLKEFLCY